MGVNQDLADSATRQRLHLLRLEGGTVGRILAIYDRALRNVKREIARAEALAEKGRPLNEATVERLDDVAAELETRIRDAKPLIQAELFGALNSVATEESAAVYRALNRATAGLGLSFSTVPQQMLLRAVLMPIGGKLWADRLAFDLFKATTGIQTALGLAVSQGLSIPNTVKALKRATQIRVTYRGRLTSIARTEMQRVANQSALATYQANNDVIGAVQYLATLDSRTCPMCGPLHLRIYPYDANGLLPADAPSIPRHPRCRCFWAPVTRSWEDLGFPGGREGQQRLAQRRAQRMSYESWLKRQPVADQREIMGDWRYEAWKGGAALDSFQDQRGLLTAAEYRFEQ